MASGKPSLLALLGLLAVAGFKHRDKITSVLEDARSRTGSGRDEIGPEGRDVQPSFLDELRTRFNESPIGETLSSGLSELMARLREGNLGAQADSWVRRGDNDSVDSGSLEHSLGHDTLAELSEKTGMTKAEILQRLSTRVAPAVDHYTPEGRLPTNDEASAYI